MERETQPTPRRVVGYLEAKRHEIEIVGGDGVTLKLTRVHGGRIRYELHAEQGAGEDLMRSRMHEVLGQLTVDIARGLNHRGKPPLRRM